MKYSRSACAVVGLLLCACLVPDAAAQTRRVNAPYFAGTVGNPQAAQAAVFWFGRVDPQQNYADVRVAYTDSEVWIRLTVFDQWLWHDTAPTRTPASLETWDAATVVLDTNGATSSLSASSHRFIGELSGLPRSTSYQAAYVGTGTGWSLSASTVFSTEATWRGDSPNTSVADDGWVITFHIPYSSLGVSGPPAAGAIWRLGALLHDKDSLASPAVSNQFWPGGFMRDQPTSWGQLAFGLRPADTPPIPPTAVTHTIRHGLNGAVVSDAMVGGAATCGGGGTVDHFSTWGANNYAHSGELVVQNQGDVADWPCFSKIYVDFPLGALPAGKSVVSATLTIYQFGGSDPSQALRSLVQVSTVAEPWDENTITWNTAPLAVENVAQSWVDVIPSGPIQWPGSARTWNVSWAMSQAYSGGQPVLRLVLYEADGAYHSGKYFTASETGDWNAIGRPALSVVLADTGPTPPSSPRNFRVVQ